MRLAERLMYILGCLLSLIYFLTSSKNEEIAEWCNVFSKLTVGSIIFIGIVGAQHEGLRPTQYLFILMFLIFSILIMFSYYSSIALSIYTIVLTFVIIQNIIYGENNFSTVKMVGPYQVGHKEFYTFKKGIAVSCYYPMDRKEYKKLINKPGRNTYWLRYA